MHIQDKPTFCIERKVVRSLEVMNTAITAMPMLPAGTLVTYKSIISAVWQPRATENEIGLRSSSHATMEPYGSVAVEGQYDVDYLFALYASRPDAFHGSDKVAFCNRESVFNLVYNLLGYDFVSLFNRALAGYGMMRPVVDAFGHVLGEIGFIPNKPHRPVREMRQILEEMHHENAGYQQIHRYGGEGSNITLQELYGLEPSENSTSYFIVKCIEHGGIAYLINTLQLFYGTTFVRTPR